MFTGPYVALALMLAAEPAGDRARAQKTDHLIEVSWSDAEDRIQGALTPPEPVAGRELHVSVHVGTFEGKEFDGPVTLTLRPEGQTHGQTVTVQKAGVAWANTFVPDRAGPHWLDVSFRTTRLKMVHARFDVRQAPLSRWLFIGFLALCALAAVGLGARRVLKKQPS